MEQNLFKPTYLRSLCSKYDLAPSKRYGQNFLISDWPIKKMIEAAGLSSDDTVIEIGPGFGALTFALAERVKKIYALEIERKLEEYWNEKIETEKLGNLEIVWGNALQNLSLIAYRLSHFKVVANLPYQITSHVLRVLLELENKPAVIVVMVQKEVAEKICAVPSRKTSPRGRCGMSMLSVSVQYYGEPEIIAKVGKGNFWPEPKVDSAILKIEIKPSPRPSAPSSLREHEGSSEHRTAGRGALFESMRAPQSIERQAEGKFGNLEISDSEFFKVVKAGFASKRKQLWKNLSQRFKIQESRLKNIIKEVVGNEKARAEELSVGDWIEIVEKLAQNAKLKSQNHILKPLN